MNLIPLSSDLSVSGQIAPEDLLEIARAGFKAVVCNRPDGESPDQLTFQALSAAASNAGLVMAYLPVISGQVTQDHAREFGVLLGQLPKPVVAYCRSGMRSAMLWVLLQAGHQPWSDAVQRAVQAGFNLGGLKTPAQATSL